MQIPIDILLIYIVIQIILFFLTVLLIFVEPTVEKTSAGLILIAVNIVICIMVALSYSAVDFYGFDYAGEIVHNVNNDLYPFMILYWGFFYINLMLSVYCGYLFWRKPWEEFYEANTRFMEGPW